MKPSLLLISLLAACGTDPTTGGDGVISGVITQDATWSGTVELSGFVTIDRGVTVTVAAGTTVLARSGAQIEVDGTLAVNGEKGNAVTLKAKNAGEFWLGESVTGTFTMHYGLQTGGGINTNDPAAKVTVIDSELSHAIGDFIVLNDGTLDVEYTNLGVEVGDHTHCNLHFNGSPSITFTHTTNAGVAYGLMLYGGSGDFTHNNWVANRIDIEPNARGTGHFDDSYFERGVPGGVPGSTFDRPASARLADCGPR